MNTWPEPETETVCLVRPEPNQTRSIFITTTNTRTSRSLSTTNWKRGKFLLLMTFPFSLARFVYNELMRYRSWPDETRPSRSRNQIWCPIPEEKIIPRTNIQCVFLIRPQKLSACIITSEVPKGFYVTLRLGTIYFQVRDTF